VITNSVFVGVWVWDDWSSVRLIVKSSFKLSVDGESIFVGIGGGGGSKPSIKSCYKNKKKSNFGQVPGRVILFVTSCCCSILSFWSFFPRTTGAFRFFFVFSDWSDSWLWWWSSRNGGEGEWIGGNCCWI